jgi:hypothetical protein
MCIELLENNPSWALNLHIFPLPKKRVKKKKKKTKAMLNAER